MSEINTKKPDCVAAARAVITTKPKIIKMLLSGSDLEAKEALLAAQDAGILAAKKTQESIPMCSPLPVDNIEIGLNVKDHDKLEVQTVIKTRTERTSAKVEALSATTMIAFMLKDYCMTINEDVDVSDIGVIEQAC